MKKILFKNLNHVVRQAQRACVITGKFGINDGQYNFVRFEYSYYDAKPNSVNIWESYQLERKVNLENYIAEYVNLIKIHK